MNENLPGETPGAIARELRRQAGIRLAIPNEGPRIVDGRERALSLYRSAPRTIDLILADLRGRALSRYRPAPYRHCLESADRLILAAIRAGMLPWDMPDVPPGGRAGSILCIAIVKYLRPARPALFSAYFVPGDAAAFDLACRTIADMLDGAPAPVAPAPSPAISQSEFAAISGCNPGVISRLLAREGAPPLTLESARSFRDARAVRRTRASRAQPAPAADEKRWLCTGCRQVFRDDDVTNAAAGCTKCNSRKALKPYTID